MKTERMTLKIAGFFPIKSEYKKLHAISAAFFLFITLFYVVLASIHAFLNLADLTELSETITFLMSELAYIGKILNVFFYRKNLMLIEDMLENPILTELETEEEESILKQNFKYSRFFTNILKVISASTVSILAVKPIFGNSASKNLIFPLWLPFDPKNHYVLVYFCEVILLTSSALFNIILDSFNILMMDLCATQFEIFKSRLTRITSSYIRDEVAEEKIRLQKLRKYVIYHNYIYRFVSLINLFDRFNSMKDNFHVS